MLVNLNPPLSDLGRLTVDELLPIAKEIGYHAVQFPSFEIRSVAAARDARMKVEGAGLQWGLGDLPFDVFVVTEGAFEIGLERLDAWLPVLEAAGVRRAYNHMWPSQNQPHDQAFEIMARRLERVFRKLDAAGIQYGVEFLGPPDLRSQREFLFIHRYRDGIKLLDYVDRRIGFVVDTFHWYTGGGTLEDIQVIGTGERIVNVHVNDALASRTRNEQRDLERGLPLEYGIIDAVGMMKEVARLGYTGCVTAEPLKPYVNYLQAMSPLDAHRRVYDSVANLLTKAGVPIG